MAPTNRASWLTAKQALVNAVEAAPYTPPSVNEIVIKTKAIAINPSDVKIQKMGILITAFPAILGCDAAGEVVEVHPSLAGVYSIGDRVISSTNCLEQRDGTYCYSGFQEYVVLKAPKIAKIPDGVDYKDAVVLPLGLHTAASCLFHEASLGLEAPTLDGSKLGKGQTVLVWGGSSSVGSCAVQMLRQAGYEVAAVASGRNHDMVKSLGASICFDQADTTIVDDIVAYLKGKDVAGAFDAVSQEPTLNAICDILSQVEGKKVASSVKPGAERSAKKGVRIVTNFSIPGDARFQLWKTTWMWLEKAMAEKRIQYMPRAEVVGHGLESVQPAVDLLAKGVSAKKLVVTII